MHLLYTLQLIYQVYVSYISYVSFKKEMFYKPGSVTKRI